jgi:uncharacterized protein (DUF2236 family)
VGRPSTSHSPAGGSRPIPRPPRGIRDVAAESVLIAAGGRAILLQIANPAVGRGVAAHSDFASRPLDRLQNTLRYVYTVVFGTAEQARAAARTVARAHAPVREPGSAEHPGYSAFDPQLQLWVAATLYDSAIDMHERIYGPLDDASAERVYREYAVLGTALQVPEGMWPADRAAFRRYWNEQLELLRTDESTRQVAQALLHPRVAPPWLKLAMPVARLATAGLLPPRVREAFDLNWSAARQRRFDAVLGLIRAVYPRLPRGLRQRPRDLALREAARASRSARS